MKTFVIAGTREEFNAYVRSKQQNNLVGPDYKYVSHADDIKGYTNPHGVFVGNWLGRPDIFPIVEALMMRSTHVNKTLSEIYSQVKPKVKPTPKKFTGQFSKVIVDEAAELLAREIDAEVLKNLTKKINGGVI